MGADSSVLRDVRDLVVGFWDTERNELRQRQGVLLKRQLTDDRAELAKRLVMLLMTTEFLNNYTKDYLSNSSMTYRDVATKYGANFNTVKASVWYYARKLSGVVGADALRKFKENTGSTKSIERLIDVLEESSDKQEDIAKNLIMNQKNYLKLLKE